MNLNWIGVLSQIPCFTEDWGEGRESVAYLFKGELKAAKTASKIRRSSKCGPEMLGP